MKLTQRDHAHIWHPLTQHQTARAPVGIVKASGSVLIDEHGNSYIDGIASWYTAMFGHCNPYITQAMTKQMQTLDFVMFSGFTHEPAIELIRKIGSDLAPQSTKSIF